MADYSGWVAVQGEGHRFGVMTCLRCGAAVVYDEDRAADIHNAWHAMLDAHLELPDLGGTD